MATHETTLSRAVSINIIRRDMNVDIPGQAVIAKAIGGQNVTLSSTGIDAGTGDVTVNASGGAAFTQPAASPITMVQNEEVTVTHPAVTNEKMLVNVFEEQPGAAGLTNIETDFDVADESKFTQEDATNGTDFVGGVVKLHGSGDANQNLLLHNDEGTFKDEISGINATIVGTATLDTAVKKFGAGSLKIVGGTGSQITFPHNATFNLAGDFTIELWANPVNLTDVSEMLTKRPAATLASWILRKDNATWVFYATSDGSAWNIASAVSVGAADVGVWTHVAVVRSGNTFFTFKNGVQVSTWTSSLVIQANTDTLRVGGSTNSNETGSVNIDEVRISNIARWTANFTPPTAPYTITTYPTAQSSYITTAANSQISTTGWADINSVILTQVTPVNTSLKYLVSFNNRLIWKTFNAVTGVWDSVVTGLAELQTAGMSKAALEVITQAQWKAAGGFLAGTTTRLDFAVDLSTTVASSTPELDLITINYNASSLYETASVGRYGSTADYGIKRTNPTQTMIKKQSIGSKKVFLNIIT